MTDENGESDVRRFLRDDARSTVVPVPPIPDLLVAGARAERNRNGLFVGLAAAVVLAAIATGFAVTNRSSGSAAPTPINPAPSNKDCPQLVADVPPDLTTRRVHVARDMGTPAAVGVIWSDGASDRRGLNIGAAPTDQEYGDGVPGTPTTRQVQGVEAEEIVNDGITLIRWKSPTATTCPYWSVVSEGLSEKELLVAVESVRQADVPKPEETPSTEPGSLFGPATACSDLPPIPTDQEVDSTLDREGRQIEVYFNRNGSDKSEHYVINYESDETCVGRTDVITTVVRSLDSFGASTPEVVSGPGVSSPDVQLARAFVAFNQDQQANEEILAALHLSASAHVSLGQGESDRLLGRPVIDDRRWRITPANYFRGSSDGTFSALDTLDAYRVTTAAPRLNVSTGPHPRCVGPNVESSLAPRLHQISLQPDPDTTDSCLNWFSIDLYVDDQGMVQTIDLDLYEP